MQNDYFELKLKAIKYDNLIDLIDKIENIYENAVLEAPELKAVLDVIKIIKL